MQWNISEINVESQKARYKALLARIREDPAHERRIRDDIEREAEGNPFAAYCLYLESLESDPARADRFLMKSCAGGYREAVWTYMLRLSSMPKEAADIDTVTAILG